MNYAQACDEVERTVPQSKERDMLIDFIRASKRGIIKPFR
jgi:UDP-N-acetylglucosamine acyltransferase